MGSFVSNSFPSSFLSSGIKGSASSREFSFSPMILTSLGETPSLML